jgi:hypothetical protein
MPCHIESDGIEYSFQSLHNQCLADQYIPRFVKFVKKSARIVGNKNAYFFHCRKYTFLNKIKIYFNNEKMLLKYLECF